MMYSKNMNQYITGTTIKSLREKQNLTQAELAKILCVSDKTISKWETGRGFPDITFFEPLAKILKVSIIELLSGNEIINQNKNSNLKKSNFYTCPICGNVIFSVGNALISCCGIQLLPLEVENQHEENNDHFINEHKINIENIEDEIFVSINHPMEKNHFISWIASITFDSIVITKLYPEQNAECRFKRRGQQKIFTYCNRHGLFEVKV